MSNEKMNDSIDKETELFMSMLFSTDKHFDSEEVDTKRRIFFASKMLIMYGIRNGIPPIVFRQFLDNIGNDYGIIAEKAVKLASDNAAAGG